MTFGLTTTGFTPKLLQDVLSELSTDQKGAIDPNWDTDSDSVAGQVNGTFARQVALGWEALQALNDGMDPDKAEDSLLVSQCKLTGTIPRAASYSIVVVTCNLTSGVTLLSGTHFANVSGLPSVRATPLANYTAPTTGLQSVTFRAENTGPVTILAGTLTAINTPVTGWSSVTNPLDAVTGAVADTNETLRPRRVAELTKGGSTTQKALRAKLLALVVNGIKPILSAKVYTNETPLIANNLPPNTLECVIFDSPTVDNNLIAQTIWDGKVPSIPAKGTITATATDSDGDQHQVQFSRVSQSPVYLTFNIKIGPGYVGDAAFIQSAVTAMTTYVDVGSSVLVWDAQQAAAQAGVLNLQSVFLGLSASPGSSTDVALGPRSIAVFDTSRVVVNHV